MGPSVLVLLLPILCDISSVTAQNYPTVTSVENSDSHFLQVNCSASLISWSPNMSTDVKSVRGVVNMEIHATLISPAPIHKLNRKIYCLANCSFETGNCDEKLVSLNVTNINILNVESTVTLFWDLGNADAAECLVPSDQVKDDQSPSIAFRKVNKKTSILKCSVNIPFPKTDPKSKESKLYLLILLGIGIGIIIVIAALLRARKRRVTDQAL